MGFPLSFSKSRRAKQPDKGRAARFRALEERALLSAVRVTALDFLTFEGSNTKTGAINPERFDWHEVGCGRSSGGHTAACWGSQELYRQDMLSMSAKYADAALAQTNADALAAEKTQNAALRDAAIDAAHSAYKVTVRSAWNNSYLMNLASGATAKTDDEALAAAANASLESAAAAYRADAFADYGAALDDLDMIDRIAAYQQERVDRGISVPNDAFADLDDPDFEYQVCFAAGTLVLMADGTTKPIETVRPGDLVLASDHLDPESKPVPARVVRFFDNGLKEVVRVRFEGGTELVCTPGHRFYVVGQGWKHASELALGDSCLSADGKRVAFEGRDAIAEPAGVFNLEVEGKHTYFVKIETLSLLVHNTCPICGGNHPVSPSQANVGGLRERLAYWLMGGDERSTEIDCRINSYRQAGLVPDNSIFDSAYSDFRETMERTTKWNEELIVSAHTDRTALTVVDKSPGHFVSFLINLGNTLLVSASIDKVDRSHNGPIEEYYGWLINNQGTALYTNDRMTKALSKHPVFNRVRDDIRTKIQENLNTTSPLTYFEEKHDGYSANRSKYNPYSESKKEVFLFYLFNSPYMLRDAAIFVRAIKTPLLVDDATAMEAMIGSFAISYSVSNIDYENRTCLVSFKVRNDVTVKSSGIFRIWDGFAPSELKQTFEWQEVIYF